MNENGKKCGKWNLNLGYLELIYGHFLQFKEHRTLFFNVWAIENKKTPKKFKQLFFEFLADFLPFKK